MGSAARAPFGSTGGTGCRVQGAGCRAQGAGRRAQGAGHLLVVLVAQGDHPGHLCRRAVDELDSMVGHDFARVAVACVEEARRVKLDGVVGLRQVAELGLTADGACQAEDTRVHVEDVRRADACEV